MWDLIVSVPDHCLSFYFEDTRIDLIAKRLVPAECQTKRNITMLQNRIT